MVKGYIFDMDGVIWNGDKEIPYAVAKINELMDSGKQIVFMTNNASRSRISVVERLKGYGINTDVEHVITSAHAACLYIKEKQGPSKVFALGTKDLEDELSGCGHTIVEKGADYVVNGLDLNVNYKKMNKGLGNLLNGAELLACAPDVTFLNNDEIWIGSGAIAIALEAASGTKAQIIGKPKKTIINLALKEMGIRPEECMGIGDKIDTDILAAQEAGIKSVLVLTGETGSEEAEKSEIKPDYIINDLRELP